MKRMKRIGSLVLTAAVMVSTLQGVLAADIQVQPETDSAELAQTAAHTITGFPQAGEEIAQVAFTLGQDKAELIAAMPQTIAVSVDGTQETVDIPVTWECLGDYEGTDDFYYQFNPVWDESTYALADGLDALTDVPYVTASRGGTAAADGDEKLVTRAMSSNAYTIYSFLVKNIGYNTAAACGVLANIECESNFNPNATGDSGTSYGICQWHNSRWDSMKEWCGDNGYDWKTLTGQLNYLKKELSANNSSYLYNGKTINNKMKTFANTADGAYSAGDYWCRLYEVPANKETVGVARGNKARDTYWKELKDSSVSDDSDNTASDGKVYSIFKDVKKDAWYCSAIQYVYDKKVMTGTSKTTFEPNTSTNRATAATVLYKLSKADAKHFGVSSTNKSSFTDVPSGSWYSDAVKWAAGAGIVAGSSSKTFGPKDKVTREQFAVMLYNYAKKLSWNVSASTSLNSFSDGSSVHDWAKTAMKWAVAKDIMNGSGGKLTPRSALTRAQMASMVQKFARLA